MGKTVDSYLGSVSRSARLRLALTQAEAARRVGLAPGVYGRLERGRLTPSVPTLLRLCQVLELDANALLGFSAPTQPPWLRQPEHRTRERPAVRRLRSSAVRLRPRQLSALANLARHMPHA